MQGLTALGALSSNIQSMIEKLTLNDAWLIHALGEKVHELREAARVQESERVVYEQVWEHEREARDKRFSVHRLSEGIFRVEGPQIERWVVQTDWGNEEALSFLQHRFGRIGLEKRLVAAGARNAVRLGADGLVVSNHGGRQLDGAIPTARALPRVVDIPKSALDSTWTTEIAKSEEPILIISEGVLM